MSDLPPGFHEWRWFRKWKLIRRIRQQRSEEMIKLQDDIARCSNVDELRYKIAQNAKDIREHAEFRKSLVRELKKKKGKFPWDYNERKKLEERINKEEQENGSEI